MFIKPFLLLALGCKALSLPMTDEVLEERNPGAWIANFDISDTGCKNAAAYNDLTGLTNGACTTLLSGDSVGLTLGVSWGDIDVIDLFADNACTSSKFSTNITRNSGETGFCSPLSTFCSSGDPGGPCFWESVMGHGPPPPSKWDKPRVTEVRLNSNSTNGLRVGKRAHHWVSGKSFE